MNLSKANFQKENACVLGGLLVNQVPASNENKKLQISKSDCFKTPLSHLASRLSDTGGGVSVCHEKAESQYSRDLILSPVY